MKRTRLLIPVAVLATALLGSPAVAADDGPGGPAVNASVTTDAVTGTPSKSPAGVEPPAPTPMPTDLSPGTTAQSSQGGAPEGGAETAPAASEGSESQALTQAAGPGYVAVKAAYSEVDVANGIIEIHGTGTPGAIIKVSQYLSSSIDVKGLVTVAADGTWNIGTVTAFDGRVFSITQDAKPSGPVDSVSLEVQLSTDPERSALTATMTNIDIKAMTGTIVGTGIPGDLIMAYLSGERTTVGADGKFSLPVRNLQWGKNSFLLAQTFHGRNYSVEVAFTIDRRASAPTANSTSAITGSSVAPAAPTTAPAAAAKPGRGLAQTGAGPLGAVGVASAVSLLGGAVVLLGRRRLWARS